MPEASNTVQIGRARAEVFAFLANGETGPQWRSGVLDVRLKSGQSVGAIYEQGDEGTIWPAHPGRPRDHRVRRRPADRVPRDSRTRASGRPLELQPVAKTMRAEVAQLERLRAVLEG